MSPLRDLSVCALIGVAFPLSALSQQKVTPAPEGRAQNRPSSPAETPPPASVLIEKLRSAVREEMTRPQGARPGSEKGGYSASLIAQLDSAILRGDQQAEELLRTLGRQTTSPEVRKLAVQLADTYRQDRDRKEANLLGQAEQLYKRLSEIALTAGSAKDLDPVIGELARLRDRRDERMSEAVRQAQEGIEAAIQFAMRWQDYLAQRNRGNEQAAREIMRGMSSDATAVTFVPRSELLARAQGEAAAAAAAEAGKVSAATVNSILDGIKTLDDIESALKRLHALRAEGDGSRLVEDDVIQALTALQKSYAEMKAGVANSIHVAIPHTDSRGITVPLRAQLLLLALPRFLGTKSEPKPAEKPLDYIERVLEEAKAEGNWPLYVRTLEAQWMIAAGAHDSGLPSQDASQLKALLTAHNLEKAGQFTAAVTSYQAALRGSSAYVPAEVIGARMKAIREAHPSEYEAAYSSSTAGGRQAAPAVSLSHPAPSPPLPQREREREREREASAAPVTAPAATPAPSDAPTRTPAAVEGRH